MQTQETTRKTPLRLLAAAVPLALLVACGGGGGGSTTTTDTTGGTTGGTTSTGTATGVGSGTTTGNTLSATVPAAVTTALAELQGVLQACLTSAPRETGGGGGAAGTFSAACDTVYTRTATNYLHSGGTRDSIRADFASTTLYPAGSTVQTPSQVLVSTVNNVTYAFADFAVRLPSGVTKEVNLVAANNGANGAWQFYGDQRPYELKMRGNLVRHYNWAGTITGYASNLEVNIGGAANADNGIQTIAIAKKPTTGAGTPFVYAHNLAAAGAAAASWCFTATATAPTGACPEGGGNWRTSTEAAAPGQIYVFAVTPKAGAAASYEIPQFGSVVTSATSQAAQAFAALDAASLTAGTAARTTATAGALALTWAIASGYVNNVGVNQITATARPESTVTLTSGTTATAALTAVQRTGVNVTLSSRASDGTALHSEYE